MGHRQQPQAITVTAQRHGDVPAEIQLSGAGYQLPQGLEIPITKLSAGQQQASLSLDTQKIAPGTYSFIINSEAQVPVELTPGNKQTIRCVYPSNPVTVTVTAAEAKK